MSSDAPVETRMSEQSGIELPLRYETTPGEWGSTGTGTVYNYSIPVLGRDRTDEIDSVAKYRFHAILGQGTSMATVNRMWRVRSRNFDINNNSNNNNDGDDIARLREGY